VTEAGVPLRQQQVWQVESGDPPRRLSVGEAATFAAVFGLTIADLVAPPEEAANRNVIELGRKFAEWRRDSGILAARLREIDEQAAQLESGEEESYVAATVTKYLGYSDHAEQQAREFDELAATYSEIARAVRDRSSVWSVIASMRGLVTDRETGIRIALESVGIPTDRLEALGVSLADIRPDEVSDAVVKDWVERSPHSPEALMAGLVAYLRELIDEQEANRAATEQESADRPGATPETGDAE
jgi:hypothetical protein